MPCHHHQNPERFTQRPLLSLINAFPQQTNVSLLARLYNLHVAEFSSDFRAI